MKQCPKCGTATEIAAATCLNCGHGYRTQFTPTAQTQAISFTPPVPLDELSRQYTSYWFWWVIAVFFIPCLIGLIGIYSLWNIDREMRFRVAQMGYDADAWERPLLNVRWKYALILISVPIALIVVLLLFGSILGIGVADEHRATTDATQQAAPDISPSTVYTQQSPAPVVLQPQEQSPPVQVAPAQQPSALPPYQPMPNASIYPPAQPQQPVRRQTSGGFDAGMYPVQRKYPPTVPHSGGLGGP